MSTRPLGFFHKLPLAGKMLFIVVLLGLLAAVITFYLLINLRAHDQAYRQLLNRDAQAAVLATESLNTLNDASRLVFSVLTEQEAARMRMAFGVLDGHQASFHDKVQKARSLLPEKAAELDRVYEQEVEFFALAAAIVEAAARWRGDKALKIIHEQFEPLLNQLRQVMEDARKEHVSSFEQTSELLSERTRATQRNAALAISILLILIVGLTLWMAMTQITRPIERLTHSMRRLSQRDYSEQIQYLEWQDEIGQMAQALEVFRSTMQRADYLEVAKAEAEHLAQAKSAFLSTMSHEIRTPLNAIIGLVQLSLRSPLPPEQQERLCHIHQAGEHLLGVINNILDFSRLESGHVQTEIQAFSTEQLLDDVHSMLADRATEKGLELECRLEQEMPVLLGDPLRIRQILLNFAGNAIKFSDKGQVRLGLKLEDDSDGLFLYGEVLDQGPGLTEEQISGLFQPFKQADSSINRRYGGTGLGLAISYSLAKLLGGTAGVESRPGLGSRFWFRVAVKRAAAGIRLPSVTEANAVERHPEGILQGLRILVVDDNELNRLVATELLAAMGMATDQAGGGQQAVEMLELAADGHYDLVFMDLMMPGLDGYATARLLRKHPRFESLPIIAMTANTSEEDVAKALAAGMNALVPKPIDEALLVRTLLRYCRAGQAHGSGLKAEALTQPMPPQQADESVWSLSIQGFELQAAIARLANNPDLYLRLVRGFLKEQQDTVARVRQSLTDKNTKAAVQALHSLKGLAASLGALVLQEAAARAEAAVIEQSSEMDASLEALEERLHTDREQLKRLVEQLKALSS